MTFLPSPFLRRVLAADAAASGAVGVVMLLGADSLAGLLGLPPSLLFYAGLILIPYAAVVALVAARPTVSRAAIWAIVTCNALWAADSIVLLVSGWVAPSALGYGFVVGQALVVAAFAELQVVGMKRAAAAPA